MKITHEAGSRIVTLDSADVGDVVRYGWVSYGVVVFHECLGRGVLWLASSEIEFGINGDTAVQVVDAELVIRDGVIHE